MSSDSYRASAAPLIAGYICLHASMSGSRMAAPLFALGAGFSQTAAGMLVALFAVTQVFLSLPAGRYADRHGLKGPLLWGVLAASTGVGIMALWPVYPVLCIGALLSGGATGAVAIALQRHIGLSAANAEERKRVFYWVSAAPAVGNFIGPFTAGLMIDHAGFRAAFLMLALMPLAAWVLGRSARETVGAPRPDGEHASAWHLLRIPSMQRVLLLNFFAISAWELHGFMLPLLGHERGLPASAIGTILGAFAISAACVRFAMPIFASRLQEWVLITAALVAAGLVLFAYPFTASVWTMGLCSSLLGATLGSVQPVVLSLVYQITPSHRHGEVLALRLMMVNASAVAMPMVLGLFGSVMGASGVFWLLGGLTTAGSRLGLGLRRDVGSDR